jgi:hypothetical protein
MTRNYFSRAGGPYFVYDGYSKNSQKNQEPDGPDKKLFYIIMLGFVITLGTIATFLYFI